jgi:hypothetical protein
MNNKRKMKKKRHSLMLKKMAQTIDAYMNKWRKKERKNEWMKERKCTIRWVPVAHTYNPSYSGGRDQEDSLGDPISKIPIMKRAGRVVQGEGPEFMPQ